MHLINGSSGYYRGGLLVTGLGAAKTATLYTHGVVSMIFLSCTTMQVVTSGIHIPIF
jgi:hypothetical protein